LVDNLTDTDSLHLARDRDPSVRNRVMHNADCPRSRLES